MTNPRKPRYNRCDHCGRNAHKVAVAVPARKLFAGTPAERSAPAATVGFCPSCYPGLGELPAGSVVVYDRRARH